MELAEIVAAATEENLTNPDGSQITTDAQLEAARAVWAATNPGEDQTPETPEEKAAREAAEAAAAEEDPLLKVMLADRRTEQEIEKAAEDLADIEPTEDVKADQPQAKPPEKPAEEPKPADKPAEKPKKAKRFSIVKPESAALLETVAIETPSAHQTVLVDTEDDQYIKGLTEEQQDELYEAQVAEMLEPVKFKGQRKKLIEFFRKFDREMPQITSSEPEIPVTETDRFKALVKEKPTLDPVIVKRVNRKIGEDAGAKKATAELSPQIEDIKITQRRQELAPKFEKFATDQFKPGVITLIKNDPKSPLSEAIKIIEEKGVKAARDEGYGLEAAIYHEESEDAARRVQKFLLLKNNAVQFNAQNPDPDHLRIFDLIEKEGKNVADYEARTGKRIADPARKFLPRMEFTNMLKSNPEERASLDAKNWRTKSFVTFTDTMILDTMAQNTKNIIEYRVKVESARAEAAGFERRPKGQKTNQAKTPSKAPTEINPPRANPTPAPGASRPVPAAIPTEDIDVVSINYPELRRRR